MHDCMPTPAIHHPSVRPARAAHPALRTPPSSRERPSRITQAPQTPTAQTPTPPAAQTTHSSHAPRGDRIHSSRPPLAATRDQAHSSARSITPSGGVGVSKDRAGQSWSSASDAVSNAHCSDTQDWVGFEFGSGRDLGWGLDWDRTITRALSGRREAPRGDAKKDSASHFPPRRTRFEACTTYISKG
ncbi:hypothetical protein HYPSUDRAFT_220484 [Hypholoma sublateritium FD-334 SS-4]|uniref:Uncharacterized protein n=1 Tax=Hypholoma sublateritium (strain FD-334 SS-4) TaxID=945553 RepID=A0A0D2NCY1_HYPSF|nr:hypothetical protein HYPSUDRAFT_220484 [Hypholoma sublateritium FD-334 SS-4]